MDAAAAERLYREFLDEIAAEFPGFRLIRKDRSPLHLAIHFALCTLTLGLQRAYLAHYVTTLGERVYVPAGWEAIPPLDRYATLRHERVHLRQFRRLGFPAMAFLYLLFPLPVGLAWGRMRLEAEAYAEGMRAAAEVHGRAHVASAAYRDHLVALFTGPAYAWMWPFRADIERWYEAVLEEIPTR